MRKAFNALRAKAHPISMLLVGMLFIPLGIYRYPAFIIVGTLYIIIGLRGFHLPGKSKSKPTRPKTF